jgi:ADP-ribosylglycohydrolase
MFDLESQVKAALFGVAVGDALGVPVEFKSRENLDREPVTEMLGYGTFNQPPGTWSDDSSLTFCLAEALTHGFDLELISKNFVEWYVNNLWTARGSVFDVGNATLHAIERLKRGVQPDLAGRTDENSNGNGSLMRILPLVFYVKDMPISQRFEITRMVCAITHAHIRSVIACFYFIEFARQLLKGTEKFLVYQDLKTTIPYFLSEIGVPQEEVNLYSRLLAQDIFLLEREKINSSGFVLDTLEASVWCLLTTHSFEDAVLKAVNLGQDTDTTGAVTGGLAALLYGFDKMPEIWLKQIARFKDIENLAFRLTKSLTPDK